MHVTTIIGNLGRDPEVRATKNGSSVANLAVAVNEYRGKDQDPITHWYNVVAWGQNALTAESLEKGDRVVVVGKMVTRKWEDKDGNDRYSTELVADDWNGVLAPAPAPKKRGRDDDDDDRPARKAKSADKPSTRKKRYDEDEVDDEIPF
jgi:single-strand DNA-binding protein